MADLFVSRADALGEGQRCFVDHGGQQIAVLRVQGELVAYLNVCPHQGGPVCEGMLIHKVEDVLDEQRCHQGMRFDPDTLHIACPWHGWEFNARTGVSAGDGRWSLRRFPVVEREGDVYVQL